VLGDEEAAITELESATQGQSPSPITLAKPEPAGPDLKQMVRSLKNGAEMEAISNALEENGWNRKRAATVLNISYKALLYKIRQYDIKPRRNG
jgi:DNA-binding NtrC family response regulator